MSKSKKGKGLDFDEINKELKKAVIKEIKETHRLGLPTTHGDKKGVYRLYPDGRKVYIKLYGKEKDDR